MIPRPILQFPASVGEPFADRGSIVTTEIAGSASEESP